MLPIFQWAIPTEVFDYLTTDNSCQGFYYLGFELTGLSLAALFMNQRHLTPPSGFINSSATGEADVLSSGTRMAVWTVSGPGVFYLSEGRMIAVIYRTASISGACTLDNSVLALYINQHRATEHSLYALRMNS